jgi:MFS family permease
VFATVCVDLLGFGLVMPLLPIYGKELLADLPPQTAGWILGLLLSSFSLMQFLVAPVWGRISDRIGRRPVLLLSLVGSSCFYALFGWATVSRSLTGMFLARIGAGIAGATIPTAQAYIADVTTPEKRARGMALIGAAFGLGFTLGPLIGAAALKLDGVMDGGNRLSPWPGYLAAVLSGIALLVAVFKLPESSNRSAASDERRHFDLASLRGALAIPSIGLLLTTGFLGVFALATFEGTLSLAIDAKLTANLDAEASPPAGAPQTPEPQTGNSDPSSKPALETRLLLLFAYIGIIQCLVQGVLVRRLAGLMTDAQLAATGAVLAIAGFVLLAAAVSSRESGTALLLLASAIEVSGIAFLFPAVQSLLSRRSDPAEQGGILGAGESISAIARITGVVFGVRLFKQAAALPYWSAAGMMAVALLLVLLAVRSGRDWAPS